MNKFISTIFVVMCVVALSHCLPLEDEKPKPFIEEIRHEALAAPQLEGLEEGDGTGRQKRQFFGGYGGYGGYGGGFGRGFGGGFGRGYGGYGGYGFYG